MVKVYTWSAQVNDNIYHISIERIDGEYRSNISGPTDDDEAVDFLKDQAMQVIQQLSDGTGLAPNPIANHWTHL